MLNGVLAGSSRDLFPGSGAVIPVGGSNAWYHADISFTVPVDTITLTISSAPAAGGDATLIVDNISIVPEPSGMALGLFGLAAMIFIRLWRK